MQLETSEQIARCEHVGKHKNVPIWVLDEEEQIIHMSPSEGLRMLTTSCTLSPDWSQSLRPEGVGKSNLTS